MSRCEWDGSARSERGGAAPSVSGRWWWRRAGEHGAKHSHCAHLVYQEQLLTSVAHVYFIIGVLDESI